ncbi:MAG: hypothetical protein MJA83_20095 [Gammaproteobacteria bacterium]|nr:hypothetical protein [Gammaproteobacteria bacterium]
MKRLRNSTILAVLILLIAAGVIAIRETRQAPFPPLSCTCEGQPSNCAEWSEETSSGTPMYCRMLDDQVSCCLQVTPP